MKGTCIGLRRFVSKAGKNCRVAVCAFDVPPDKGFGVQTEEIFLPQDAIDPVLNGKYVWSYNRSGFCDMFARA